MAEEPRCGHVRVMMPGLQYGPCTRPVHAGGKHSDGTGLQWWGDKDGWYAKRKKEIADAVAG
jgi:hypothetical protein